MCSAPTIASGPISSLGSPDSCEDLSGDKFCLCLSPEFQNWTDNQRRGNKCHLRIYINTFEMYINKFLHSIKARHFYLSTLFFFNHILRGNISVSETTPTNRPQAGTKMKRHSVSVRQPCKELILFCLLAIFRRVCL